MNKCLLCGAEVPSRRRFCSTCRTVRPNEANTNKIKSVETVTPNPPEENTHSFIFAPPRPQPQQPSQLQQPHANHQPFQPPPSYKPLRLPPVESWQFSPFANTGAQTTGTTPNIGMSIPKALPTTPVPTTPVPQEKTPVWRKWVIIAVIAVVIVAGLETGLYFALKPRSDITVTSDYRDSSRTPTGATDTVFHVKGEKFSPHSVITFLLGSKTVDTLHRSDGNGNLSTDLKVTSNWPLGHHQLTAHDANNNTTNTGQTISIVEQGFNGTPGPNGAPTNTATFKINLAVQMGENINQYELDITGRSDSQGGKVCLSDDGVTKTAHEPIQYDYIPYTYTYTLTCNSSNYYKNGQIFYDNTLSDYNISIADGYACSLNSPQPYVHLTGSYTASHQFSGSITLNSVAGTQFNCTGRLGMGTMEGSSGTWSGSVE